MVSRFHARLPYFLLVVLTLLLDRWTKSLVQSRLLLNSAIPVIDGFLNITYVRNTGVAFGIFTSISSPAKSVLLSLFTALAATFVVIYSVRSPVRNRRLQVALSLILGGALGNLYDRISSGSVVDFIEIYFRDYQWPSFNVADSAICLGVVLLGYEIFRSEATETAPNPRDA